MYVADFGTKRKSAISHEALVGVKCIWKRGRLAWFT